MLAPVASAHHTAAIGAAAGGRGSAEEVAEVGVLGRWFAVTVWRAVLLLVAGNLPEQHDDVPLPGI